MSAGTQSVSKPRFYAGLYMRTKKKVRFWGWGSPGFGRSKWESPSPAELERPWAALADWLRMAHSLAGTNRQNALPQANTHSENIMAAPIIEQPATPPAPRQDRKFRFVCDRHFIGLVYR
ncbi:MAG: hypothetical protein LAO78_24805 [Acidobacteriia bacterium]|nr:hypothetical protein [Terriglobia bacterium]